MRRIAQGIAVLAFATMFLSSPEAEAQSKSVLCINERTGNIVAKPKCKRRGEMRIGRGTYVEAASFEHLQTRVDAHSESIAGLGALQAVVNGHASSLAALPGMQSMLTSHASSIANLQSLPATVSAHATSISSLQSTVDSHAISIAALQSLDATVSSHTTSLASHDNRITANATAIATLPRPATVVKVAPGGTSYYSIEDAVAAAVALNPSNTNPVMIEVAPGIYDVSTDIILPSYVSLRGSGRESTVLMSTTTVALSLLDRSSLSDLSIEVRGEGSQAVLIDQEGANVSVRRVKIATAGSGVNQHGVFIRDSSVVLEDIEIAMKPGVGDIHYGISVNDSAVVTVNRARISSVGGNVYGIIGGQGATLKLNDIDIDISLASAINLSGVGVKINSLNTSLRATNVRMNITQAGTSSFGVGVGISSATDAVVHGLHLRIAGPTHAGVLADDSGMLRVHNAVIVTDSDQPTAGAFSGGSLFIGNSQLSGGAVDAFGAPVTCAGVYDANFSFSGAACP